MLFYAQTYTKDRPLFAKLGLKTFAWGHNDPLTGDSNWHDVGTVELDSASVRIEVCCLPAQFYRFTIEPKIEDVQHAVLTTGSGGLSDFWPAIELWAEGMLGYEKEFAAMREL